MKLNELFPNTFKALAHRSGPDKSSDSRPLWQQRLSTDSEGKAYAVWYQVTQEAQRLLRQPIHLSPLLELHATPAQKERKIDLTDYLWEQSSPTEGVG